MKTIVYDHFISKVKLDDVTGCLNWTAFKTNEGYGRYTRVKGITLAHRASYAIHVGPIPEGLCVCHKCDNPSCVNPEHLFLGDRDANNKDRASKGRTVTPNMNLTHCKRGHEFNDNNTTLRKNGTRKCRLCVNMKSIERYHRKPKIIKERKIQIKKTHCKRGHELVGKNVYIKPDGYRTCNLCLRLTNGK